MSIKTRFVNAVSVRSTSNSLEPGPVHPLVSWLSRLWLLPKRLLLRRRLRRPVIEQVAGRPFVVLPNVFNPVIFRTGRYLAEYIRAAPALDVSANSRGLTALDVGTGCGIHAIFAAERGFTVEAVDISEEATRCATINVMLNDVGDRVSIHQGDLFLPVTGQRFDLVMCSLPKFRGSPESAFEIGWKSTDVIDKFSMGLPKVLKRDGIALVLLTSHGDERGMLDSLVAAGLRVEIAERKHFGVEIMTIYRVTHRPDALCGQGEETAGCA